MTIYLLQIILEWNDATILCKFGAKRERVELYMTSKFEISDKG
jgi:hypothetical protein